jgi:hypothetical protein
MDRATLTNHLRQAEEHVVLGEQHIARQRVLIAELERNTRDTAKAAELLKEFEELQRYT